MILNKTVLFPKKNIVRFSFLFLLFVNYTLSAQKQARLEGVQVAFLSDVHLQDLFGKFSDNEFRGILNPKTGKYTLLRTMASQLHSTRIFNENYFAFLAALDDIAKRKIKYVALPGDYTDDGQPIHVRGLEEILNKYRKKYGIEFFITTGNHDPVGPFAQESGKEDFLGNEGKNQPIYSKEGMYKPNLDLEQPVVVTADMTKMGYLGITEGLKNSGFYPNKKYKFWSTPFAPYASQNYTYAKAMEAALLSNRVYNVAPGYEVPDVSYVVEPIDGLWLMAIDGNVYIPKKNATADSKDPKNYSDASTGYNNVLSNKKHLIKWVAEISLEAKKQGKTLIAFSHFPMIDFNDDASAEIKELLGPNKWQLNRVPTEEVAQVFADAGLKIHFGGHMHINDTGVRTTAKGNTLVNIQTPSLAAYIPAYKLLTIKDNLVDIQTITIDTVPGYDELFDLYRTEYQFLESKHAKDIWNIEILKTKNYHDFTDFHLKELVRLRFLADDWPAAFKDFILNVSGEDLLVLANIKSDKDFDVILKNKENFKTEWAASEQKSAQLLSENNLKKEAFKNWNGYDFLVDFYRFRSADELALTDIGTEKAKEYKILSQLFFENYKEETASKEKPLQNQMRLFLIIFNKFMHEVPADHFSVDLKTGRVRDLK
ncbi:MAG: metallophosphoesterase [Flavobacterium circumlabens]|uniref:metallophosphoesterase n=1 Tax=Flavobacterium circumlabens TaxID=2133765 RepID=UPI003265C669